MVIHDMDIKKEKKTDSFAIKISIEEHGQPVGWAHVFIKFQDRHDEPYAYLENVFVHPEYQGKGYGRRLVSLAIDEAKSHGCYKIIATSKHQKERVHDFYQKFGFVKYGYAFRNDLIDDVKTNTADGKEEWSAIP